MSKFIFQIRIVFVDQLNIAEICIINRLEDSFPGNLVKMDRACTGNYSAAFCYVTADIILIVTAIAGQGNWNHKIISVISNKIQYDHVFFSFRFSKTTS